MFPGYIDSVVRQPQIWILQRWSGGEDESLHPVDELMS